MYLVNFCKHHTKRVILLLRFFENDVIGFRVDNFENDAVQKKQFLRYLKCYYRKEN